MARLDALPSIDIILGFKGILDFYLWRGLPCVRAWPTWRPTRQTDASKASALLFGAIVKGYNFLGDGPLQAFRTAADDQARSARDLYVSAVLGHLHDRTIPEPPPPPEDEMYDAYVCLRDVKPINTPGGDFNSGAWRTRVLNNEQADTADICSLTANQITLPAGSYRCLARCPAYRVHRHQTRLYNVTASTVLLLGASAYTRQQYYVSNDSILQGRFTIATETVLELQHRCTTTNSGVGLGVYGSFNDEIYSVIEFWREVEP